MKRPESFAALQASGASDTGRVRTGNEDAFICDPGRGVFAVIDGVGGHAGGEVAAAIARRELELRLRRETGTIEDRLREAVAAANASILAEAMRVPALKSMACVLTAAVITGDGVVAAHVGDTRLYKLGPHGLRKLTRDHSPVGLLEDSGQISEDDAMGHPDRNQVFREVGTSPHQPTDPDFIEIVTEPLDADEALLLCSDGLTDLVPAAAIDAIVRAHAAEPFVAVSELIAAANRAGGKDNITAVLAARPMFGVAAVPAPEPGEGVAPVVATAPARSWPWAVAAFLAVFAFAGAAWWSTAKTSGSEILAAPASSPRVLRVSPQADADYATIAAALVAAQPGDTVEVGPGTYRESIVLRDGVVVRSHPRRAATLRRPPTMNGSWTAISASGIRAASVSGFVVAGSDSEALDYGVSALDANIEIDDLDISGAQGAAVRITGRSTPLLRSSRLHDNSGSALLVDGDSVPEILHNVIEGSLADARRPLIEVRAGARLALSGNILSSPHGVTVSGLSATDLTAMHKNNAVTVDAPVRRTRRGGRS